MAIPDQKTTILCPNRRIKSPDFYVGPRGVVVEFSIEGFMIRGRSLYLISTSAEVHCVNAGFRWVSADVGDDTGPQFEEKTITFGRKCEEFSTTLEGCTVYYV